MSFELRSNDASGCALFMSPPSVGGSSTVLCGSLLHSGFAFAGAAAAVADGSAVPGTLAAPTEGGDEGAVASAPDGEDLLAPHAPSRSAGESPQARAAASRDPRGMDGDCTFLRAVVR